MNESLYKQLTQAAFVLANSLKNKAKIAELKNSIDKKRLQQEEEFDEKIKDEERSAYNYGKIGIAISIFGIAEGVCWVLPGIITNEGGAAAIGTIVLAISLSILFLMKVLRKNVRLTAELNIEVLKEEFEKKKKENKVYEKEVNEKIKEIEKIDKECWEIGKHFLDFLPQKYRNSQAIAFLGEAVKNCRADTLKEAINLYETKIESDARWAAEMEIKREEVALQTAHMKEMERMAREMNATNKNIEDDISKIKWMEYYDIMNKE